MAIYQGEIRVAGGIVVGTTLMSDVTYYVNGTTGLDSNDGLYQVTPKRTAQAAIDLIPKNMNGFNADLTMIGNCGNLVVTGYHGGTLNFASGYGGSSISDMNIKDCQDVYSNAELTVLWVRNSSVQIDGFPVGTNFNCYGNSKVSFTNAGVSGASHIEGTAFVLGDANSSFGPYVYGEGTIKCDPFKVLFDASWVGTFVPLGNMSSLDVADGFNVGLMPSALFTKLMNIETLADVTDATNIDTAIKGASAQTTMVDTDMLPVSVVGQTTIKKITWANAVIAMKTSIGNATQSVAGLFATADKKKLDGRVLNGSVATQTGFAADTYLAGSFIAFPYPPTVKTKYRLCFDVTKTGAGVAAIVITVRTGTAGSIADTSRLVFTFGTATGVVDNGMFYLELEFRVVGSGTSAVLVGTATLSNNLAATGLTNVTKAKTVVSSGFDSTAANLGIGVSYNGGSLAAHTIQMVSAELITA